MVKELNLFWPLQGCSVVMQRRKEKGISKYKLARPKKVIVIYGTV
jgi:hypothetical protein